jgi:hypothetical protein
LTNFSSHPANTGRKLIPCFGFLELTLYALINIQSAASLNSGSLINQLHPTGDDTTTETKLAAGIVLPDLLSFEMSISDF